MRKLLATLATVGTSILICIVAMPVVWNANGAGNEATATVTVHLPLMANCVAGTVGCQHTPTATKTTVPLPTKTATAAPTRTPSVTPVPPTAAPTPGGGNSISRVNTGQLGFSDVGPRQLVRTSGNRVYAFFPEIYQPYLHAIQATSTGTPAGFAEADAAHRPTAASAIWAVDAAIDSNNLVHLLYITENGAIYYTTFNTATNLWGSATPVANSAWPARNSGLRQGSVGVSLVLDNNGVAHVVYSLTKSGLRHIYYNNNAGGTWNHEALVDDQPNSDNSHAVLVMGNDGALHVAWLADNGTKGSLRVRTLRNGTWAAAKSIDDDVFRDNQYSIDQGPSVLVMPNSHIHVAYIGPYESVAGAPGGYAYGRVHHRVSSDGGATWTSDDPPARFSHNPSLATDPQGNLYVFGHREFWKNSGCADMLVAAKPAGGAWGSWRTFASGCYDSGVSAKWSQYGWNQPYVLDLLYWTEKGPQGQSDYNQLFYAEVRGGVAAINTLPQAPAP